MKTTQETNDNKATAAASAAATAAASASQAAAIVSTNIEWIKKDISEIKDALHCMSSEYVTQVEFRPIKAIVFGMVGVILVAVISALLGLIIFKA